MTSELGNLDLERSRGLRSRRWILLFSGALMLVMLGGTAAIWRYDGWQQQRRIRYETDLLCHNLAMQVESALRDRIRPLRRVENDIREGRITTEAQFREVVKSLQVVLPILPAFARFDQAGVVQVEPSDAGAIFAKVSAASRQLEADAEWCSGVEYDDSGPFVIVVLTDDQNADGRWDDALAAKVMLGRVLMPIVSSIPERYQVSVRDHAGAQVMARPSDESEEGYSHTDELRFAGRLWTVKLQWRSSAREHLIPAWALAAALLACLVLPAAVAQFFDRKWRETMAVRRQARDLATLAEESVRLSAMMGTGQELFEAVLDAAIKLVGLPAGSLGILEEENAILRIAASRGLHPLLTGRRFPHAAVPTIRSAIDSGEIIVSEDIAGDERPINKDLLRQYGVRSMIILPLTGRNQPIGSLVLCDPRPRRFDQRQIQLARLWSAQASAILTDHFLWRRMSEAMEGQKKLLEQREMLLKELNHRVNNNLAAIVGLLSAGPTDLPLEAARWVDRVLGRIVMMARSHEMFLGHEQSTALRDIVANVIKSLAVFKRPDVEIRTELAEAIQTVTIGQAVALAMVLHELCANALQYGIGARGVLTIRGGIAHDRVIQIDVIDDGSAVGVDAGGMESVEPRRSIGKSPDSGGIGLQLVRELVGRELKGEFWSEARDGGGRMACVRFGA